MGQWPRICKCATSVQSLCQKCWQKIRKNEFRSVKDCWIWFRMSPTRWWSVFLSAFTTGNKSWMFMGKSCVKTMLIVFFDTWGITRFEFLLQRKTANSAFYQEVLKRLKWWVMCKGWHQRHSQAPPWQCPQPNILHICQLYDLEQDLGVPSSPLAIPTWHRAIFLASPTEKSWKESIERP